MFGGRVIQPPTDGTPDKESHDWIQQRGETIYVRSRKVQMGACLLGHGSGQRRVEGLDLEPWQQRWEGLLCRRVWRQDGQGLGTGWLDTAGKCARDYQSSPISRG